MLEPETNGIWMRSSQYQRCHSLPRASRRLARLDILVQPKRDRFAAIQLFRRLVATSQRRPRTIIIDKLRSYGAANEVVMPGVATGTLDTENRAENSH